MTENNLQEKRVTDNIKLIPVDQIKPSPHQHRKVFKDIEELAENIQRDGLIHPIVVRDQGDYFELVVGERRLRAVSLMADEILADIRVLTDLQVRRIIAAENMQRDNPSDVEFTRALVDVIDAELYDHPDYLAFGDDAGVRVKTLLMKLDSDFKHKTDYFGHKFMSKVETIFKGLPRKKEWRSFYVNDLPLLNIDIEILEIAEANGLNKSQTKSLDKLKKENMDEFKKLVSTKDEKGKTVVGNDDDGEVITLRELSANDIKKKAHDNYFDIDKNNVLASLHTGDEESYTPIKYLDSARLVMGCIDLDPASNPMAQENVQAGQYFTIHDDGLKQKWSGNVWMNPPYTALVINRFIEKLVDHYQAGDIQQSIVLTNNNTDTSWFHLGAKTATAICFTSGRINFLKRDGTVSAPTNGQSFFYFGDQVEKFKDEFSQYGLVMVMA